MASAIGAARATGSTIEFANVSAISGLNMADDGRAVVVTDWDLDGDVDFWVSNRSGPQVRFLMNSQENKRAFLAVRLHGTVSNRDAIGARVIMQPVDGPAQTKTVRAGDAYLSQSSKWLHFGLGAQVAVSRVDVHWPGGETQRFESLEPNQRYVLVEGRPRASEFSLPDAALPHPRVQERTAEKSGQSIRTVLTPRLGAPFLKRHLASDHSSAPFQEDLAHPLLVNLWASWCGPCVSELHTFTQRGEALTSRMKILALNVDALSDESASDGPSIVDALTKGGTPVEFGVATPGLVDDLQKLMDRVYDLRVPLSLPTSLLIDRERRLAVIYRGPVDPSQLLKDVEALAHSEEQRRASGQAFAGTWSAPVGELRPLAAAIDLLDRGRLEEAEQLVRESGAALRQDGQFHKLLFRLGEENALRGEYARACQLYEQALGRAPDFGPARYQLGMALALRGKREEALVQLRRAVASDPRNIESRIGMASVLISLRQLGEAQDALAAALEIDPSHASANYELAVLLLMRGQVDASLRHYRAAVNSDPAMADTRRLARFEKTAQMLVELLNQKGPAGRSRAAQIEQKVNRLRAEIR